MRRGVVFSGLLHLAVILLIIFGLPDLFKRDEEIAAPIPVQLATLADLTAQSKPAEKRKPAPAPAKPTPPPPAPKAPAPPQLQPTPQPQAKLPPAAPTPPAPPPPPPPTPPKPKAVQAPPPEAPKPVAIPEKPKPQPPQEAKVEPPPVPVLRPPVPEKPKPKKPKPQQTADFNSLLKNIEKMQPKTAETPPAPQPAETPPQPRSAEADISAPKLTMSEVDALQSQIGGCWYIDPGQKGADSMVVDVRVHLAPDGTVLSAQIVDTARMLTDSYYRAAAEAARRAVWKCSPLHVPPDKYETWKNLLLHFNPSGMTG